MKTRKAALLIVTKISPRGIVALLNERGTSAVGGMLPELREPANSYGFTSYATSRVMNGDQRHHDFHALLQSVRSGLNQHFAEILNRRFAPANLREVGRFEDDTSQTTAYALFVDEGLIPQVIFAWVNGHSSMCSLCMASPDAEFCVAENRHNLEELAMLQDELDCLHKAFELYAQPAPV